MLVQQRETTSALDSSRVTRHSTDGAAECLTRSCAREIRRSQFAMFAFTGSDLCALWVVGIHREYGGGLETTIRPWCYNRGLRAVSIAVYRPRSDHIRGRPDVRRGDWCNLGRFASPLARSLQFGLLFSLPLFATSS